MAGENAELGFSVDTSQVETASSRLDALAQSAQGATESANGLSDAINNVNTSAKGMHGGGFYSGLSRPLSEVRREAGELTETIEDTVTRSEGWLSRLMGKFKENHQAQREMMVMMHESLSGNFSRLRGSASIFAGQIGLGGFAGVGIVAGISVAAEAISSLVEDIQAANEATKELNQSAIMSGQYGLLDPDNVDNLIATMKSYNDQLDDTNAKLMLSKELQAGLSEDQIKKLQSSISQAANLGLDPAAISKMFADPSKNIGAILTTFRSQLSETQVEQINNLEKAGKTEEANALIIQDIQNILSGSNAVLDAQNGKIEKQLGLWQKLKTGWVESTQAQAGDFEGAVKTMNDAALNRVSGFAELFLGDVTKIQQVVKATDKTISETEQNARKNTTYHAPKVHHGLTEAEKAAKRLIAYQTQIKQAGLQFDQQINSIGDSVNKAWNNKLYSYSMTSDQHDFANRIETINEQFDRMRENVDKLALQHHKSIGSKEYVEMFQKIELGRKNVLAENMAGYEQMESYQSSAIAGMNAGWIKYQKQVNDVASQSEQVFDSAASGMTDALTDFFTTGEAGWENYFKSIATMIEKYMVQDWVVKPIMGYLNKGMNTLMAPSADAALTANSFPVPSMPRLGATRGGLGATNWAASAPVQVNVYNQGGNNVTGNAQGDTKQAQDMARQVMKSLQDWIKQQNVKSNRQGGINKSMGNWSTR